VDRGESGVALDSKDVDKMEANVYARSRDHGELGDSGAGVVGEPVAKTLLGWGNAIQVGDVSFLVFGIGLQLCDSA
jgi:hypothetical protein